MELEALEISAEITKQSSKYNDSRVVSLNRKVNPNLVFSHAKGSKIYGAQGKRYIDDHSASNQPTSQDNFHYFSS